MKIFKKINKGLVLTVIVLTILVVYLICVEVKRNNEKPNIESACKDYIETINEFAVIPKDYQKIYTLANTGGIENFEKIKDNVNKSINRSNG